MKVGKEQIPVPYYVFKLQILETQYLQMPQLFTLQNLYDLSKSLSSACMLICEERRKGWVEQYNIHVL